MEPSHQPIRIQSIRISNLRSLADIEVEAGSADEDRGQWLVFLGENGVGKTTILRALALTLSSPNLIKAIGYQGERAPFLRFGASAAKVEVTTRDHGTYRWDLEPSSNTLSGGAPIPLWGYGCQRGNALGGAKREVSFAPLGDTATLFDLGRDLIHAETWLRQLSFGALKNSGGADETFFEAVCATLKALLPGVETIEVEIDQVWLEGPSFERAPLAGLSDGYLTTTGWVLDMIARWSERVRKNGGALDGDFRAGMTGLVLLDEIDLHLHPYWQRRVIQDLRRELPRMSFVATTHQPMSLLGAEPGEVHVLRRDPETDAVFVEQLDVPPGTRADQVLTGEWFGLASTLDAGTLDLLERHRGLLKDGRDGEEAERIVEQLRERLGRFADTSVERLAQSAAAEILADERRSLTVEERRKVRARILKRVRRDRSDVEA
jgi:hypothetical protein